MPALLEELTPGIFCLNVVFILKYKHFSGNLSLWQLEHIPRFC